jgi:hypothetical protein
VGERDSGLGGRPLYAGRRPRVRVEVERLRDAEKRGGRHLPGPKQPPGRNPTPQNLVAGETAVIVKSPSELRQAGLAAVRITWITAILVCALAVLSGVLSGSHGSGSSQQFPGFAFTDGGNSSPFPDLAALDPAAALLAGAAQANDPSTQKPGIAGPGVNGGRRVNEQASGDSDSRARLPRPGIQSPRSQPDGGAGKQPSSTSGPNGPQGPTLDLPKLPQAPSVSVNVPKPPQAPSVSVTQPKPSPPQAPSGGSGGGGSAPSAPSLPQVSVNVSSPIQTPIVKVPDVSVNLP